MRCRMWVAHRVVYITPPPYQVPGHAADGRPGGVAALACAVEGGHSRIRQGGETLTAPNPLHPICSMQYGEYSMEYMPYYVAGVVRGW